MSNTSTIHIKTDFDCKVYDYGQEIGTTKADIFCNFEFRKGEHELTFVFVENESISQTITYKVEDADSDYKLFISIAEIIYNNGLILSNEKEFEEAFALFEIIAEKGDTRAQYQLGNFFFHGLGIEQNYQKAKDWYLKASEKGLIEAIEGLGEVYWREAGGPGDLLEPEPEELIKSFWLFYQAAIKGSPNAQYQLGFCYDFGYGITPDEAKAIGWYTKSAEKGHIKAQLTLGHRFSHNENYFEDVESIQDNAEARKWFQMAAEQNSAEACVALGYCYFNSKDNYSFKDAEFWFLKAISLGSIEALFSMGSLYFKAFIDEAEDEHSFENNHYFYVSMGWFRRAANNGHKNALFELGKCYQISNNDKEAYLCFQKASIQGIADAQFELGNCYRDGIGIEQDYDKALEWYEKAANSWNSIHLGRAKAQFELGNCYYLGHKQGWNTDVDIKKAFSWYLKAAEGGLKCAQYTIEVCYRKGIGVEKNARLANQWEERKDTNKRDPFDIDSYNIYDGGFSWESNPIVYEYLQELEKVLPNHPQKPILKLGQKALLQECKIEQTTIAPLTKYYLFFDTETTGIPRDFDAPTSDSWNWPRLVQLSWITTDEDCNILSENDYIIYPDGFTIPEEAVHLHGITTDIAKEKGKPLQEVIEKFMEDFNAASTIVGHNI